MCLGFPGRVLRVESGRALVKWPDYEGWLEVAFLEDVQVGDYLLNYQGVAINKVSKTEAKKTLKLLSCHG